MDARGQPRQGERLVQVVADVLHRLGDRRVGDGGRHGPLGELGLAALAVRGHDHAAGKAAGDLLAVVGADQVEAQVDARGRAGGAGDVAVVDIQHVGHDGHGGIAPREQPRVAPVRGGGAAIEQPGAGQHERAGADRDDARAPGVRGPQRRDELVGRVGVQVGAARHDHGVGQRQPLEPVLRDDVERAERRQPAGVLGADVEVVPPLGLQLGPVEREYLDGDHQLEGRQVVGGERDDPVPAGRAGSRSRHVRIISEDDDQVTSWTTGPSRHSFPEHREEP